MAEEVNVSVVFKYHKKPPEGGSGAAPPKKIEETIYDEVKVQSNETEQPADANVSAELLPDKEANSGFSRLQQLLCCLGILCVLFLIGLCVHVALSRDQGELSQLRETNNKLRSDNTNLESNITNLAVQLDEVMGNNTDLKIQNTNLSTRNQDLETQQRNWNKLNVSRAQWSVDNYCPKKKNKRSCQACQDGWKNKEPFCYTINDASPDEQKTWEEAREDCKGKSADLAVVNNNEEKNQIKEYSWGPQGSKYWLGLKVEDGQWKWVDGTDLSRSDWIDDPVPGHCAVSVHVLEKWRSVRCDEKNRWICRKDALSV